MHVHIRIYIMPEVVAVAVVVVAVIVVVVVVGRPFLIFMVRCRLWFFIRLFLWLLGWLVGG